MSKVFHHTKICLSINKRECHFCVTSVPSCAEAILTFTNRKVLAFVLLYLYHQILKMHSIVGIFIKKKSCGVFFITLTYLAALFNIRGTRSPNVLASYKIWKRPSVWNYTEQKTRIMCLRWDWPLYTLQVPSWDQILTTPPLFKKAFLKQNLVLGLHGPHMMGHWPT